MTHHARPHLTTHTRSKGHSAIAGIAYRLGLRLQDRRTGEWHDYRRREAGDEIVGTLTVAPEGAPPWVMDPQLAWDAVEAAERRKDSQLAHDFRVPIPFGLTGEDAVAMARRIALSISSSLHTFVYVGVHRDAAVDAMGFAKPLDQQGFHAHIYFPTRKLTLTRAEGQEGSEDEGDGSGAWALGEKLRVLSNKATAAACIERFNAAWAEAANEFAAAAGRVPDFTHLSYARLGLAKLPQVTLGAAATALERRGIATSKGDSLRERERHAATATRAVDKLAERRAAADERASREWLSPRAPIVFRPSAVPPAQSPSSPTGGRGLAERFWADLSERPDMLQPSPEQRERLDGWLRKLERALRALARIGKALIDLAERHRRDDGARATFAVELHAQRTKRGHAQIAVKAWTDAHPWQLTMAKALGGVTAKPVALLVLEEVVAGRDDQVQQLKRDVTAAEARMRQLDAEKQRLAHERSLAEQTVVEAVERLRAASPLFVPVLLSLSEPADVPALTQAVAQVERTSLSAADLPEGVTLRSAEQVEGWKASRPRLG